EHLLNTDASRVTSITIRLLVAPQNFFAKLNSSYLMWMWIYVHDRHTSFPLPTDTGVPTSRLWTLSYNISLIYGMTSPHVKPVNKKQTPYLTKFAKYGICSASSAHRVFNTV